MLAVDSRLIVPPEVENDAEAGDELFRWEGNGDDTTGRRAGQKVRRRRLGSGFLPRLPLALIAPPGHHPAIALWRRIST